MAQEFSDFGGDFLAWVSSAKIAGVEKRTTALGMSRLKALAPCARKEILLAPRREEGRLRGLLAQRRVAIEDGA
jgi:hypothetical protein